MAVDAPVPASGTLLGGTVVTVHGTGFTDMPALVCMFGSVNSNATYLSPVAVQCAAPTAAAAGTVSLTVTSAASDGTATTSVNSGAAVFTYTAAPIVQALSPVAGPAAGGTVLTLSGSNFTQSESYACRIGSALVPARRLSTALLQCTAPERSDSGAAAAAVTVALVVNSGAVEVPVPQSYVYSSRVIITGVFPPAAWDVGGAAVTVTGGPFTAADAPWKCWFGARDAPAYRINDTAVECAVPPLAASAITVVGEAAAAAVATVVVVSASSGSGAPISSAHAAFTYTPALIGSSVHPASGSVIGGTLLTVTLAMPTAAAAALQQQPPLACLFGALNSKWWRFTPAVLDSSSSSSDSSGSAV
eukprot:503-Heterococcus_DN1.PRE.1